MHHRMQVNTKQYVHLLQAIAIKQKASKCNNIYDTLFRVDSNYVSIIQNHFWWEQDDVST